MIERQTIDGRPALVVYLDDNFEPVTQDKAKLAKVVFMDAHGGSVMLETTDGDEGDLVDRMNTGRENSKKKPDAGDAWSESDHPRGQPGNKGQFAAKGSGSSGRAPSAVRPSPDDPHDVAAATFEFGKVIGNASMPIGKLSGGVASQPAEAARVRKLAEEMSGPDGHISRLVVDDEGNVLEGQHRLEALRALGAADIPVTIVKDMARGYDLGAMRSAVLAAKKIHPDQVHGVIREALDVLHKEGGNVEEALQYDVPGFQEAFEAAVKAARPGTAADVAAKITKEQANYVDAWADPQQSCSRCSMFRDGRACTLVDGMISPQGHCDHFEAGNEAQVFGGADAAFEESKHPRDEGGKWTSGGGASRNGLTKVEKGWIQQYSGEAAYKINDQLRAGGDLTPDVAEAVKHIDSALAKSRLHERTTLYRSLEKPVAEKLLDAFKAKRGAVDLRFPGYTSTTDEMDVAELFADDPGSVILSIDAPAGTPGLYTGYDEDLVAHMGESEVLLPRGLRVRASLRGAEIGTISPNGVPRQVLLVAGKIEGGGATDEDILA